MYTILQQIVFVAGGQSYDWADVVLGAKLRGEWADLEADVRQGLACLARAEQTEEGPSPAEVNVAAQEFRYERDLITAQETEAWLAERGLTVEAWTGYIERSVMRRQWEDELADIVAQYPPSNSAVEALIEVEGFCSGWFARFASALAARVAVYDRVREETPTAHPPVLIERVPAETLPPLSEAACQKKLEHLARLEAAFQGFRAQALTARAVQEQLSHHYLDWIRFDCRSLTFGDEQMAREAALSVREDGQDLGQIAEQARVTLEETSFYLDDAKGDFKDRLLGGKKGDVLGPFEVEGNFVLFEVLSKQMPSADDPRTRARATEAAWKSLTERETATRVGWRQRL
jgi:hypothetical protein